MTVRILAVMIYLSLQKFNSQNCYSAFWGLYSSWWDWVDGIFAEDMVISVVLYCRKQMQVFHDQTCRKNITLIEAENSPLYCLFPDHEIRHLFTYCYCQSNKHDKKKSRTRGTICFCSHKTLWTTSFNCLIFFVSHCIKLVFIHMISMPGLHHFSLVWAIHISFKWGCLAFFIFFLLLMYFLWHNWLCKDLWDLI